MRLANWAMWSRPSPSLHCKSWPVIASAIDLECAKTDQLTLLQLRNLLQPMSRVVLCVPRSCRAYKDGRTNHDDCVVAGHDERWGRIKGLAKKLAM